MGFQKGDVVRLKSGSRPMTVTRVYDKSSSVHKGQVEVVFDSPFTNDMKLWLLSSEVLQKVSESLGPVTPTKKSIDYTTPDYIPAKAPSGTDYTKACQQFYDKWDSKELSDYWRQTPNSLFWARCYMLPMNRLAEIAKDFLDLSSSDPDYPTYKIAQVFIRLYG